MEKEKKQGSPYEFEGRLPLRQVFSMYWQCLSAISHH